MKIVFMGTPDFALYSLRALAESKEHEVVAVVTQPDKSGNRGTVTFCPVKKFAIAHAIPVFQFNKISKEGVDILQNCNADIFVTAAYGQILSQKILDIPKYGIVNVHASLLPAYRGSSPIQWALIKGEKTMGVTIMQTNIGLDTGDILLQKSLVVDSDDTTGTLFHKIGLLGAEALLEFLKIRNTIVPTKQDETLASYFPMLKKNDGKINWSLNADSILNLIRGVTPWPGAFFIHGGKIIKLHDATALSDGEGKPGEVLKADKNGLFVACGKGVLVLTELQAEGKKRLNYTDFLNGNRISVGEVFE